MYFYRVTPPPMLVQHLRKSGSKEIKCWTCETGTAFLSVIYSEDPSGDKGEYEPHLSIAASELGGMRYATKLEVKAAMDAVGWTEGTYTSSVGKEFTPHVYKASDVLASATENIEKKD